MDETKHPIPPANGADTRISELWKRYEQLDPDGWDNQYARIEELHKLEHEERALQCMRCTVYMIEELRRAGDLDGQHFFIENALALKCLQERYPDIPFEPMYMSVLYEAKGKKARAKYKKGENDGRNE